MNSARSTTWSSSSPAATSTARSCPNWPISSTRGIVRVLDLVLIKKQEDGSYEAFEFDDIDSGALGELRELERELADLLSEEDVRRRRRGARSRQHSCPAGLREPVGRSVRLGRPAVGWQLVANGRIPVQALIAALELEIERDRRGRRGGRTRQPGQGGLTCWDDVG